MSRLLLFDVLEEEYCQIHKKALPYKRLEEFLEYDATDVQPEKLVTAANQLNLLNGKRLTQSQEIIKELNSQILSSEKSVGEAFVSESKNQGDARLERLLTMIGPVPLLDPLCKRLILDRLLAGCVTPLWRAQLEDLAKQEDFNPIADAIRERERKDLQEGGYAHELEIIQDSRMKAITLLNDRETRIALCLSGGGIRSAVFNLGMLQGFASRDFLQHVDFLSTVSGGGYIGSFFTSLINRDVPSPAGISVLRTSGTARPEQTELRHIRTYKNFLSPRFGFFSIDTWTLIATYLRNLFLNSLVLLSAVVGVLAIPLLIYVAAREFHRVSLPVWDCALVSIAFMCGVLAVSSIIRNLKANPEESFHTKGVAGRIVSLFVVGSICLAGLWLINNKITWLQIATFVLLFNAVGIGLGACAKTAVGDRIFWLFVLGAICLAGLWCINDGIASWHVALFVLVLIAAGIWWRSRVKTARSTGISQAPVGSGTIEQPGSSRKIRRFLVLVWKSIGLVGISLISGLVTHLAATDLYTQDIIQQDLRFYVTTSVPMILLLSLFTSDLIVGLLTGAVSDLHREWKGRFNALMLVASTVWGGLCLIVLYGPEWVAQVPGVFSSIGGVAGLVSLILGYSGRLGPVTDRELPHGRRAWSTRLYSIILGLTAPIALFTIGMLLSALTGHILREAFLDSSCRVDATHYQSLLASLDSSCRVDARHYQSLLAVIPWPSPLGVLAVLILAYLMSLVIDINRYSLHSIYRDRLIRTFLGATNKNRRPDRFTDIAEGDNIPLSKLGAQKPVHILNLAVNVSASANLIWQDRRAASFTASKYHCGSWAFGYRRSKDYLRIKEDDHDGVTLGTMMAVSGAAVSPNMGYLSSSPTTMLLALLNARLGWWVGNPGLAGDKKKWFVRELRKHPVFTRAVPSASLGLWFKEALGLTDQSSAYVCLSDGGHFENLGLYEMVLRRCGLIVVCDATCDPRMEFEDLSNALRRIREDLGIEINLELNAFGYTPSTRMSKTYMLKGTINYGTMNDGRRRKGTIVYIKASLTGREPADVQGYYKRYSEFPHQSTGDQFFDDSQFEAYRRLGEHIAQKIELPIAFSLDLRERIE